MFINNKWGGWFNVEGEIPDSVILELTSPIEFTADSKGKEYISTFNDLAVGKKQTKIITIKNSSNADISVAISRPSKFKIESLTCGAILEAGATCDIVVSVTLTKNEGFIEKLKVVLNASDETTSEIILSANKVGGSALLMVYPKSLPLIVTDINKRTDENKVTISNVGNATMTLDIPTNDCIDRGSNSNCRSLLEAGRSCDLFYSINIKEKYDSGECNQNFFGKIYYDGTPDNSSAEANIMLTTNAENANDYAYRFSFTNNNFIEAYYPEVGFDNIRNPVVGIYTFYSTEKISFYREDISLDNSSYYELNKIIVDTLTKASWKTYSVKVYNNSNTDIKLDSLTDDIEHLSDLDPYADYRLEPSSTCRNNNTLKAGKTGTIILSAMINTANYYNGTSSGTGVNLFIKKGDFTIDDNQCSEWLNRYPRFDGDEYKCRIYDKNTVAVKFSLMTR